MSEEFENNNENIENENVAFNYDDEEETKISKFQIQRRRKQAQLKRQVRKSKNNIRFLLFLSRVSLIIFLLLSCYFVVRLKYWRLNPHAFDSLSNTSIKIENNYIVSSDRILKALKQNPVPRCPIFLMNTDDIKKSILEITPIQDVYIKRFWFPARIEILVEEKEPALTIAPNEEVPPIAFITRDGTLIGRAYLPLNPSIKTVKVLTYGSSNGAIKFDESKIKFILTIAKDIEDVSKEPVQYIDLRNPDDIYVQIPSVKIKLGSVSPLTYPDTYKKIRGLPSIIPKVKILNKKVKYVDLRWQNNLYYIKLAE
jgi:cell division septal protein FtsQ